MNKNKNYETFLLVVEAIGQMTRAILEIPEDVVEPLREVPEIIVPDTKVGRGRSPQGGGRAPQGGGRTPQGGPGDHCTGHQGRTW